MGLVDERAARLIGGEEIAADKNRRGTEYTPQTALPDFLAGWEVPAHGEAGVLHRVKIASVLDHRWDIPLGLVLPRSLAGPVGMHGGDVVLGIAAARDDEPAIADGRCDAFLGRAIH